MRSNLVVAILVGVFSSVGCSKAETPATSAPAPVAGAAEVGGEISKDPAVIAQGEKLFTSKTCSACHQMEARVVGPPLKGITGRRSVAWLTSMIKDPTGFTKTDPEAKKLLAEYKTPMPPMPMTDAEISAVIAFLDTKK